MSSDRFSVNDSLWIFGGKILPNNPTARSEMAALRNRGAKVYVLTAINAEGLEHFRRHLWQSDDHAVMMWLHPREVAAIRPVLLERKNYSAMLDDWWIIPHWFTRNAEYKLFRKYNGVAVRLGWAQLVEGTPPIVAKPEPMVSYAVAAAALRLPSLAISPVMEWYQRRQQRKEEIRPEKLLYLPFSISRDALPLLPEKIQYDFATTGTTTGPWLMRDAFAPFRHTFGNLYYDRRVLANGLARFADNPYKIYDWRRLNPPRPPRTWEEYTRVIRQSRFTLSTGGLQNASVPKFLEYACLGTPMIGRLLPFEFPWLEDCLFPIDILRLKPGELGPLLRQALECQPKLRENCLNWRDRLLQWYEIHALFEMLQRQADGEPIPPGYLKTDLKHQGEGKNIARESAA